ncbi:MAG: DUF1998 domain-containing protein, partial [Myxococcales bacterium]|nr:DUF1998 domain-containing protein [Myxococcales bacterium]
TIGNPETHAARLIGRPVRAIEESGAPTGERRLLVYQPPIVNAELGIRASYLKSAVRLTMDLIRARVPTLVFGQSRNGVEVMLKYLRDRLPRAEVEPSAIQAYRGGYLPQKRREIEAGLREGRIRCVVATNALELGIDVGGLDAVVCAGYPGSLAQTWQRFGRAGRRSMGSLAVLVASSAPLDQFVAADPAYLTRAPVEEARIDPDNVEILIAHLKCAAFELPFEEGEPFGDLGPAPVGDALEFLARSEVLVPGVGGSGRRIYHWASNAYPANQISLRSASWDNFTIVELGPDRLLAEMDWRSTHTMLHEQAIYQHEAEQYQVERLDYDDHKAFVRKVECDYYTTAMTHSNVSVLEQDEAARVQLGEGAALGAGLGDVLVVQKVVGYKKIKFHTHENVGYGEVHLPEIEMHTTSFWLTFPESFVTSLERPRPVVIDALRGLSKAMHLVATIGLMVDPRDLGRTLGDHDEPGGPPGKAGGRGFDPTIFLYDQIPGGIGLAPRLFEQRELLLRRARQLVELCRCDDGCPACIGPAIGELQLTLRRRALILAILESLGVGALH